MNGKTLGELPASAMATVDGYSQYGITLRQHFAGLAMAQLVGTRSVVMKISTGEHFSGERLTAEAATRYADALLAELAKDQP